ncbi:MAG: hypothetical protein ACLRFM_03340 [Alphaproteobacteria bacterium]
MSNINCPYDNQYCSDKDRRFSQWAKVVATYTMPQPINPDAFSGCPNEKTCPRHPCVLTNNKVAGHEQR